MFGLPAMLWWGAAAAVPVLIHLFARQRYRRVPWAAMEFLQRAFKRTRRRIRLEHLLLLLLRILAILLFVLALADPRLETSGVLGGTGGRRDVVLIMDDSFSMELTGPGGTSTFEAMKEQAARLVRSLDANRRDTLSLVTAGRPASALLKRVDAPERALAELEALQPGHGATDYVGAFRIADAISTELEPGFEVWLFSDLQEVGFLPEQDPSAPGGAAAAEGREGGEPQELLQSLLQQLRARGGSIHVVLPPDTPTDNVAVSSLEVTSKAAVTGVPATFSVLVTNHSTRIMGGTLQLHIDGAPRPMETVPVDGLAPGGTETWDFRHTFREPGHHYVEAHFTTDSLQLDNRRHLALRVRDRLRALVVDGDRRPDPAESESFFLVRALAPRDEPGRPSTFKVTVVEETSLDQQDPGTTDLVVLMNVALLSARSARSLHNFVQDGGGLLIFLGDKVRPETYNELLHRGGTGLLPAEILAPLGAGRYQTGPEGSFEMQLRALDSPPFAYFSDPDILPYLTNVPVYRFFRTRTDPADPDVRTLAVFESRGEPLPRPAPAVLEKSLGNGRCILVTTSGDTDWNDHPAFPTMVPLVKEMAYHLTHEEAGRDNVRVGQDYYRVLRSFVESVTVSREGKPLEEVKPAPREDKRGYELELTDLDRAGIYELSLTAESRHPGPLFVAVNPDPRESDLNRVDADFLRASFPGSGLQVVADLEQAGEGDGGRRREDVWWWVLAACVGVMAAETALSQIFGSRTRSRG